MLPPAYGKPHFVIADKRKPFREERQKIFKTIADETATFAPSSAIFYANTGYYFCSGLLMRSIRPLSPHTSNVCFPGTLFRLYRRAKSPSTTSVSWKISFWRSS